MENQQQRNVDERSGYGGEGLLNIDIAHVGIGQQEPGRGLRKKRKWKSCRNGQQGSLCGYQHAEYDKCNGARKRDHGDNSHHDAVQRGGRSLAAAILPQYCGALARAHGQEYSKKRDRIREEPFSGRAQRTRYHYRAARGDDLHRHAGEEGFGALLSDSAHRASAGMKRPRASLALSQRAHRLACRHR